jgi:protein TonB
MPAPPSDWETYKRHAAGRIMATNAQRTYTGPVPEPLRAIPVLQVQLHADGRVRDILVLRAPSSSPQAVDIARDAVLRAAPFGPVGALPLPWQFTETFLFDEELRFTLRSLVE